MSDKYGETVPVRLSDETAHTLKFLGAIEGITPAEVMGKAWDLCWKENGRTMIDVMRQRIDELAATLPPESTTAPDKK